MKAVVKKLEIGFDVATFERTEKKRKTKPICSHEDKHTLPVGGVFLGTMHSGVPRHEVHIVPGSL